MDPEIRKAFARKRALHKEAELKESVQAVDADKKAAQPAREAEESVFGQPRKLKREWPQKSSFFL